MTTSTFDNNLLNVNGNPFTVVCFHTHRGGRFNNPGFKEFNNTYKDIEECIDREFSGNVILTDDKGRLTCDGNDCGFNNEDGTGCIDWDGDYNRWDFMDIQDCDSEDIELIEAYHEEHWVDSEVINFLIGEGGIFPIPYYGKFSDGCLINWCGCGRVRESELYGTDENFPKWLYDELKNNDGELYELEEGHPLWDSAMKTLGDDVEFFCHFYALRQCGEWTYFAVD